MEKNRKAKVNPMGINNEKERQLGLELELSMFKDGYFQLHRIKEALEESERKYRSLMDAANELVLVAQDDQIKYANKKALAVLGYSLSGLLGRFVTDLIHPDDRAMVYGRYKKRIAGKKVISRYEFRMVDSRKAVHWVFAQPTRIEWEGHPATLNMLTDITERKKGEEDLEKLTQRQKSILATVPDILMQVDKNKVYTWANKAGYDFFGKNVIGKQASYYFEGKQKTYDTVQPLFMGKERTIYVESWQRRKDGQICLLAWHCRPLKDKDGKVIGTISLAVDITNRRKAEIRLRESESRFKASFMTSPDAFYLASLHDGKISQINERFEGIFGYTRKETIGKTSLRLGLYANPNDRAKMVADLKKKGVVRELELQGKKKDGTIITISLSATTVQQSGRPFILGVIRDVTERKRAEEALQASEQKYRRLYETLHDAYVKVDMTGRVVESNALYRKMLGYSAKELYKLKYTDITPPKWHPIEAKILKRQILKHGYSEVYEKEYRRKDGSLVPIEIKTFVLYDPHGKPEGMWAIVRDITERKNAEDALSQSESRYRSLFNNMLEGFAYCKMLYRHGKPDDFVYLMVNDAFGKLTGLKNVTGKRVTEAIPGIKKANPELFDIYQRVITTGKPKKFESFSPNFGGWLSVMAHSYEKGYFVAVFDNITKRKESEILLKASEVRYRRLFESAKDGILILDYETGMVIDANPFLTEILGIPRTKLMGKELWQLGVFKDVLMNKANFFELKRRKIIRYENLPLETADGRKANVEFVSNVYEVSGKKVIQCNIRDITERRKAEELRDQFLNVTSHELKSPLIPIRSQCQLLLEGHYGSLNDEQKQAVNMIFRNENHSERLVSDILDISRVRSGTLKLAFEKATVENVIRDSFANMREFATKKDISLTFKTIPKLPPLLIAPQRIAQVMFNLLGNAIKNTPEGGKVFVRVRKCLDHIAISVHDTGIGMDKRVLKQLFTPFFQVDKTAARKQGGVGLGLAICKGIIEAHGGKIWGESEGKNRGSVFTFTLPLRNTIHKT